MESFIGHNNYTLVKHSITCVFTECLEWSEWVIWVDRSMLCLHVLPKVIELPLLTCNTPVAHYISSISFLITSLYNVILRAIETLSRIIAKNIYYNVGPHSRLSNHDNSIKTWLISIYSSCYSFYCSQQ